MGFQRDSSRLGRDTIRNRQPPAAAASRTISATHTGRPPQRSSVWPLARPRAALRAAWAMSSAYKGSTSVPLGAVTTNVNLTALLSDS